MDHLESSDNECEIFLENDLAAVLDAIIAFQKEDCTIVHDYLAPWSYDKISELKDHNKKNRIFLLKARYLEFIGEKEEAKKYFNAVRLPFVERLYKSYSNY